MRLLRIVPLGVLLFTAADLPGCMSGNTPATNGSSPSGSATTVQVSGASPLPAGCGTAMPTGTTETYASGSGIQPQIAVIPGGNLLGVWEQDRWSGIGTRAILASDSTDGGAAWSTPIVLPFSACGGAGPGNAYDRASDPWVTFAGGGVVAVSAIAFMANSLLSNGSATTSGPSAVLAASSSDGGVTWTTSQVYADSNAGPTLYFNDRDSIAADTVSGYIYLVWDRLTNGTTNGVANSEPAWVAISTDGGKTWPTTGANAPHVLYDPGPDFEAFNNQIVVLPNGNLLDFFTLISLTASSSPSLQVVTSTDHGATPITQTPVTVSTINSVGTQNPIAGGPAIRDSWVMAQVAADGAGNVAAVWQQSFNGGTFDGIALSVSTDGKGKTWSTPIQINGVTTVAAFSPTVRYLPGGVLAVTYYDLRDYASGSSVLSASAWLTESADGGKTWHEIRLQSPFDLNKAPRTDNNRPFGISPALFLGDNQGLALVGSSALPFYAATSTPATNTSGAHVYATQAPDPLTASGAHVY